MSGSTIADLSRELGNAQTAINMVWVLVAGFLVMFMQAGFALVETGLVRMRNAAHTMAMNFLVYAIGVLAFWAVGFALQMGGVGALGTLGNDATLQREFTLTIAGKEFGLFGMTGFFLSGGAFTSGVAAVFMFQLVFMDTTATIPTGALAERWKLLSFVLFSVAITALIYPIYANWVWGGGWLSALGRNFGLGHGHVDFAGSSVVHLTGGVLALVGARVLGPRTGKYGRDGSVRAIPGHNIPMVVVGTFILAFGWFGFNAGSTLAGTDSRISVIAVNTMLAGAAGAISTYVYVTMRYGKLDVSLMCNGMLAGLVAITAPCAFVSAPVAVLIGLLSGVLVVAVTVFVEQKLKIDDPVGAIAVHGANGAWGIVALGLFANGTYGEGTNGVQGPVRGLLYGDGGQLIAGFVGIAANVLWVAPMAAGVLYLIGRTVGNRVSVEAENEGLDRAELGVPAYSPDPGRPIIPPEPEPNAPPTPSPALLPEKG